MSSFPRPPRSFELSPYMAAEAEPEGGFEGAGETQREAPGFDPGGFIADAAAPSHSWLDPDLVPSWLKPFTLDANTRFTRTPDHLLRPREAEGATGGALPGRGWHFVLDPADDEPVAAGAAVQEDPPRGEAPPPEAGAEAPPSPLTAHGATPEEVPAPAPEVEPADAAFPAAGAVVCEAGAAEGQPPAAGAGEAAPAAADPAAVSPDAGGAASGITADGGAEVPPPLRALGRLLLLGTQAAPPSAAVEQDLAPSAAPVPPAAADAAAAQALLVEETVEICAEDAIGPAAEAPPAFEAAPSEAAAAPDARPAGDPAAPLWQPYQLTISARFLGGAVAPVPPAAAAAACEPPQIEPAPAADPAAISDTGEAGAAGDAAPAGRYELPPLDLLCEPPVLEPDFELSEEFLDQSSAMLQQVLRDFGVRGEVIDANPGPVVTLYEFEPAPGVKSSRVIGLAPDIARSMSAVSARVAVVEGRNVIGIELPNRRRDTVWLRELLASHEFAEARSKLGLCLGKTIGGVPVIADLARMPHLLVAGTTGSGKSVAINTMILSLLYRHTPEACRLIMIDPKMLELSVYEGIPHLLTQVVTDPKKAIIALKWAVKEMEERYRKMSRLAVRNIDGFNARMKEAAEKGEVITRQVPVGFDRETGEALFEEQEMDLTALPHIVVIVDEMADLMMVAGKEIEGAIQRLAQMARAAGIHLVMATQRPSVDVITGTIKANFPTRISFQVTSKIDSRTILGEMGAETLLGQGDMLFMAGGGRITRVHGPFVSDGEVEKVVAFLKAQGGPDYLDAVILDEEAEPAEDDEAAFDRSALADAGGDLYEQAIAIVLRDRKASTSYIQRRLQVGYNKAASLMERMENEGIVGPANHAGKREILSFTRPD